MLNRISPIYIYILYGFLLFFFVASSKTVLGPDERNHLELGKIFIETGIYDNTKIHPLLSILAGVINKIIEDPLNTFKVIYGISGLILSFSIFKILNVILKDRSFTPLVHVFVLFSPGVLILCLYAISNIFFTSMIYFSVYIFYQGISKNSNIYIFFSGLLIGLCYLSRMEGLVAFFLLLLFFLLKFYSKRDFNFLKLSLFIIPFVLVILPWHIYLINNGLILSSIISGGYSSGIWDDGVAKYLIAKNGALNLKDINFIENIFKPLAKNIVLYSNEISSMKLFPFFLWAFVIFGFREIKIKPDHIIFIIPSVATFSYIFFFIETRYLTATAPFLSVLAGLGFLNLCKEYSLDHKKYFLILLSIIIFNDLIFGILWIF